MRQIRFQFFGVEPITKPYYIWVTLEHTWLALTSRVDTRAWKTRYRRYLRKRRRLAHPLAVLKYGMLNRLRFPLINRQPFTTRYSAFCLNHLCYYLTGQMMMTWIINLCLEKKKRSNSHWESTAPAFHITQPGYLAVNLYNPISTSVLIKPLEMRKCEFRIGGLNTNMLN